MRITEKAGRVGARPASEKNTNAKVSYRKTKIMARWITSILGGLIFACALTLSYIHTAQLFATYGYSGIEAHLGVIMVEAAFFLGAFSITVSHFIGVNPGWPARIIFFMGVGMVGWSNVAYGMAYGYGGIIIGIVIPAFMIAAEFVIGKAILHFRLEPDEEPESIEDPEEQKPELVEPNSKVVAIHERKPEPEPEQEPKQPKPKRKKPVKKSEEKVMQLGLFEPI